MSGLVGGVMGAGSGKRSGTHDEYQAPRVRPEETEQPSVANRRSSGSDKCTHSFDPDTPVLMDDGTRKPIKDVKIGDKVQATDPATGKTEARTVTALFLNQDTDLADVTVRTTDGAISVLHTTQHHPFWDRTRGSWIDAGQLTPGDRLSAHDNGDAIVTSVRSYTWYNTMRDLTVDSAHTYYVIAGTTPVLVHNCGEDGNPVLLGRKVDIDEYIAGNPDKEFSADFLNIRGTMDDGKKGVGGWNWTRNKRFIDSAIENGQEIRLVTDPDVPLTEEEMSTNANSSI